MQHAALGDLGDQPAEIGLLAEVAIARQPLRPLRHEGALRPHAVAEVAVQQVVEDRRAATRGPKNKKYRPVLAAKRRPHLPPSLFTRHCATAPSGSPLPRPPRRPPSKASPRGAGKAPNGVGVTPLRN